MTITTMEETKVFELIRYDAACSIENIINPLLDDGQYLSICAEKQEPLDSVDLDHGYVKQFKITVKIEEIHDELELMRNMHGQTSSN